MVKILADSGCDISFEEKDKLGLEMFYLIVNDGEKEYQDQVTMPCDNLYKNMKEGKTFKTAQIPLGLYLEKFQKLAENNIDFIYISLSSGISSTFETSKLALSQVQEKYPDVKMACLDSKAATSGYRLIVENAVKKASQNVSFDVLVKEIEDSVHDVYHLFSATDMQYLFRGGRISKAKFVVGKVLDVKPLMYVDKNGYLAVKEKVRGVNKLLKKMASETYENMKDIKDYQDKIIITHSDFKDCAEELKNVLSKDMNVENIRIQKMGSAIAAHTGPGTIVITYLKRN